MEHAEEPLLEKKSMKIPIPVLLGALVGAIFVIAVIVAPEWNRSPAPPIDTRPISSALVELRIIDLKPDASSSETPQLGIHLEVIGSDGDVIESLDTVQSLAAESDVQSQITFEQPIGLDQCRSMALRASFRIVAGASLVMARMKADGETSDGTVTLLGLTEPIRIGIVPGSPAEVTIPFDCSEE